MARLTTCGIVKKSFDKTWCQTYSSAALCTFTASNGIISMGSRTLKTFWPPRIQSFLTVPPPPPPPPPPPLYFNPRGLLDLRHCSGRNSLASTSATGRDRRTAAADVNALDVCFKGDRQRWRTEQRGCTRGGSWLKSETRYDNSTISSIL